MYHVEMIIKKQIREIRCCTGVFAQSFFPIREWNKLDAYVLPADAFYSSLQDVCFAQAQRRECTSLFWTPPYNNTRLGDVGYTNK